MSTFIQELISTANVQVLDQSSFPNFVNTNKMVLVSYIHRLAPACAAFMPLFEQVAQAKASSDIRFAQIDVVENAAFCQTLNLKTFPTAVLFQGSNNAKVYQGVMGEEHILEYLTRQSSSAITTITTSTFQDFRRANKVVVMGYLSSDDNESLEAFTSLAKGMRDDFLFGMTSDQLLIQAEEVKIPSLVVYKSFDEEKSIFDHMIDYNSMAAFVKKVSRPLIVEFLPELHEGYFNEGVPLGYIFINNRDDRARLLELVQPIAKRFDGQVLFGTFIRSDLDRASTLADSLWFQSVKTSQTFVIREPVKNLRYPFDSQQEFTEKELDEFIEAFLAGDFKPTVKSDPVPEEQKSPVLDVVAFTYEGIVLNQEKDVLLQFCTSWCPYCKSFRSTYELLAQIYTSDETLNSQVTIATIDAEANDFPDRDLRGYPWFKLYPAHSKDTTIAYSGLRTLQDMAEFIRDNGTYGSMPKTLDVNKGSSK